MTDLPPVFGPLGIGISDNIFRAVANYERDQLAYGANNVKALQEMAEATLWDRATWIELWTTSRPRLEARERGEQGDVRAWLAAIQKQAETMPLLEAVLGLNEEVP